MAAPGPRRAKRWWHTAGGKWRRGSRNAGSAEVRGRTPPGSGRRTLPCRPANRKRASRRSLQRHGFPLAPAPLPFSRLHDRALELLTRQEQAALKMCRLLGRHQHLADHRNAGKRNLAQNLFPSGHHSPGEHIKILGGERLLQSLLTGTRFAGEKDHANAQRLAGVERNPRRVEQKLPRDRGHDADAIAALAVGSDRPAMRQASRSAVVEGLQVRISCARAGCAAWPRNPHRRSRGQSGDRAGWGYRHALQRL